MSNPFFKLQTLHFIYRQQEEEKKIMQALQMNRDMLDQGKYDMDLLLEIVPDLFPAIYKVILIV